MIQWMQYYQYYSILFSLHTQSFKLCVFPTQLSAICIIPLHETIPPSHQLHNILSNKVKCA